MACCSITTFGSGAFNLVLVEVFRLSLLGIAIGLALAIPLSSWFDGLLYGVSRFDPLSILLAGASLLAMAVLAVLYPVGQAVRVDPVEALRGE